MTLPFFPYFPLRRKKPPIELRREALNMTFEEVIAAPHLTEARKRRIIQGFFPNREVEFEELLVRYQEQIPHAPTRMEEILGITPDEEEIKPAVRWDITIDPDTGWQVQIGYDEDGNVVSHDPIGAPPAEPTRYGAPDGAPTDPYGRSAVWSERLGQWDYPPNWGVDPATLRGGYAQPAAQPQWRPGEQELQRQQMEQEAQYYAWQQQQAEREYGAQLAAQPRSWLEYAAYTGEQPAIQPWMLPLMPQEYQQLGAGGAIPGWQAPQAGQMGGATTQGMAGLPQLTTPSRQYQARVGPTAMQQYYGYKQARTGVTPEEEQWRLWSAAPPGGQYRGLQYTR